MKQHEEDSKLDFLKKSGKKRKIWFSPTKYWNKKRHQLDWSLIKTLAKENNYRKRKLKEVYFIKH